MTEAYESNHFLMKMQLGRIFENDTKKLTTSQFRLFSIEESNFVITITTIKKEGIWFDTSWYSVDRLKSNIEKHRIYAKDTNLFIEDVMRRLNQSEIEQAEDICLRPISKYKTPNQLDSSNYLSGKPLFMEGQSQPRYKRSGPNQKIEIMTTLIKPTNESERKQAQLERKLFHNPKMWKYQES